MGEALFAFTQSLTVIALLAFLHFREKSHTDYRNKLEDKVLNLPSELKNELLDVVKEVNTHVADISSANFSTYLKHIKELEKMILPRPVTKDDVDAVLSRGVPLAENEISKLTDDGSIALNEENFKNIPLGPNTNVVFDNAGGDLPSFEDIPTTIE